MGVPNQDILDSYESARRLIYVSASVDPPPVRYPPPVVVGGGGGGGGAGARGRAISSSVLRISRLKKS